MQLLGIALCVCAAPALALRQLPAGLDLDFGKGECTSVVVSSGASLDGAAMTTHANDCGDCDFRLARVAARDWPAGARRPIYGFHSTYPKEVSDRSPTWDASNLDASPLHDVQANLPINQPVRAGSSS